MARGHGYDLYEYVNVEDYIPLREKVLEDFDKVFCISEYGREYLKEKYAQVSKEVTVSILGTLDNGVKKVDKTPGRLNIVSCSNIVKIKRVETIVEALSRIKDIHINWTHYGEGALFDEVKQLAKDKLPSNIKVDFSGFVSNNEVLKDYRMKEYHVFINVSESEGIPVSIMEALSFGIPVVATDVGGTNEIITNNYNGILLEKDFPIDELKDWIGKFSDMIAEEYKSFRINARRSWENKFDADKNYIEFAGYLNKLMI